MQANKLVCSTATYLVCSMLFTIGPYALAGGPDLIPTDNPLNGFELSIGGLLGAGVANNQEQFNYTTTDNVGAVSTTQYGKTINANLIGGGTVALGYNIPWGDTVAIEPLFSFNFLSGNIQSAWASQTALAANEPKLSIQNTLTSKYQYNFLIRLKKMTTAQLALLVDAGLSCLRFDNVLNTIPLTYNATIGTNRYENHGYEFGPVLGLGVQWFLGHHSSVSFNWENYLYIPKSLNEVQDIYGNNPDLSGIAESNITNRKISLFLPVLSLQYNLTFSV